MKLIESEFVLSPLSPLISGGAADELRVSYQPEDGEADRVTIPPEVLARANRLIK